jgi:hypothetical protein
MKTRWGYNGETGWADDMMKWLVQARLDAMLRACGRGRVVGRTETLGLPLMDGLSAGDGETLFFHLFDWNFCTFVNHCPNCHF